MPELRAHALPWAGVAPATHRSRRRRAGFTSMTGRPCRAARADALAEQAGPARAGVGGRHSTRPVATGDRIGLWKVDPE